VKTNRNVIQLSLISIGLILILGTYFLYPKINKKKFIENKSIVNTQTATEEIEENLFKNIEYKGVYGLDNHFVVKSSQAEISDNEPNIVYMNNMHVILNMKNGKVINITSDKGRYDKVSYDCFFVDNVKATEDKTIIFADNLDLLSSDDYAIVYNNVSLNTEEGLLLADKIHYDFVKKLYRVTMFDNKKVKVKLTK
jgi:hypothetical protein